MISLKWILTVTLKKIVPKLVLQVSVQELHHSMVSLSDYGGLIKARNEENIIIISDSTLRNIMLPQLKKMVQDVFWL